MDEVLPSGRWRNIKAKVFSALNNTIVFSSLMQDTNYYETKQKEEYTKSVKAYDRY